MSLAKLVFTCSALAFTATVSAAPAAPSCTSTPESRALMKNVVKAVAANVPKLIKEKRSDDLQVARNLLVQIARYTCTSEPPFVDELNLKIKEVRSSVMLDAALEALQQGEYRNALEYLSVAYGLTTDPEKLATHARLLSVTALASQTRITTEAKHIADAEAVEILYVRARFVKKAVPTELLLPEFIVLKRDLARRWMSDYLERRDGEANQDKAVAKERLEKNGATKEVIDRRMEVIDRSMLSPACHVLKRVADEENVPPPARCEAYLKK